MRKLYLLLMGVVFFATQALAQRTVTGKVTDEKGNPLANVSVLVRGTTTGTTTKEDGSYNWMVCLDGSEDALKSIHEALKLMDRS